MNMNEYKVDLANLFLQGHAWCFSGPELDLYARTLKFGSALWLFQTLKIQKKKTPEKSSSWAEFKELVLLGSIA